MPELGKATYETRVKNKQFKAGMRETEREADRGLSRIRGHFQKTDQQLDRTDRKIGGVTRRMGKFNIATRFFGTMIRLIKWPAIIVGAGLAAQAIGALTAGVLALSASLAPLSGFLVAYPGMLAAVAQGALTVKLAFQGMSDVMKAKNWDDFREATKGWSDESRHAARNIRGLLKPALADLQNTARDQVLPDAVVALRRVLGSQMPVIRNIIRGTAKDFGDFLDNASMAFSSPEWSRDLRIIGGNNRVILRLLGESAINFARALREILVAAGPFLRWMARSVLKFSEWLKYATEAGRHTGRMAEFFDSARRSLRLLLGWLMPFLRGLWEIIKLGRPLGDTIQKDLGGAAEEFEAWTKSAKGKNAIVTWFQNAKGPIYEMARLVRDVGGVFLRLGANKGVGNVVKQIRTELLPVLETLIAQTTTSFGPHLVDALIEFAKLMGTLGGSSGPLTVMVDILGFLARLANGFFSAVPGTSAMTVNLLGAAAAFKVLKMLAPTAFFDDLSRAVKAFGRTSLGTRLGIYAITAAQWLWNASLYGFPLVWILAALIAFGIGLVILWKKSATFRKIVIATWNAIKKGLSFLVDHWEWAIAIMTGGIGLLVVWVIKNRDKIIGAFKFLWEKTKSIFNTIKNGIISAFQWVHQKIGSVWYSIYSTIAGWINKVIDIINKIPGVEIGKISIGPSPGAVAAATQTSAREHGRARGGMISPRPGGVYRVAEAGKPEMVIPLDPAMRGRAFDLVGQTVKMLSGERVVPGYALGGLVDAGRKIGGGIANAAKTGWDFVSGGANSIINLLPGLPQIGGEVGRVVSGATSWMKDKVVAWIKDKISSLMSFGGGGGAVSSTGLVPQVLRALSFARAHGWGGVVTSGFRTFAEQSALYARYLAGGPLAARPGTSSHETGQAVDVSDYYTFGRIMATAPPFARLYNRLGAVDPVHYSISGYKRGGLVAMGNGGAGVVDRPTAFMAGERGREAFAFRPLGNHSINRGGGENVRGFFTITNPETMEGRMRIIASDEVEAREDFAGRRGRVR